MAGIKRSSPRSADPNSAKQRSDEIRRRRTERVRKVNRKAPRSDRKVSPRTPPPVLSRDPLVGEMLGRGQRGGRLKKGAKRRYDVVINKQGAEVRLPSLPRVQLGWRLASFVMASILIFVLYQFWDSPDYQVEAAEVHGLQRLSSNDVNAVLGIRGKRIFELDTQRMQAELQRAFPEFSSVSVMVDFPISTAATVVVTVTERVPVLAWIQDGRTELVDAAGLSFPLREGPSVAQYNLSLAIIEAEDDPPPLSPSDLPIPLPALLNESGDQEEDESPDATSILSLLDPRNVALASPAARYTSTIPFLSSEMVSTILYLAEQAPDGAVLAYSERHGLGWKDPREWVVYFGSPSEIEMKLIVYRAILDHLRAEDTRPALVSVEYVHAPYYRLEP